MYELRIRQVPILVKVVENHYPGNVPTTDLAFLTASQKPATRCSSELIRCLTGTLVLGLGLDRSSPVIPSARGEREGVVHWLIALVRLFAAMFEVWTRPLAYSLSSW